MLVAFIQSEFDSSRAYKEIYNKNSLHIAINENGTILDNESIAIRFNYTIAKLLYNEDVNLKTVVRFVLGIQERKMCDKEIKDFKQIEGDSTCGVYYYILNKQISSINENERDIVIKRYDFYINEREFYSFASSVNDDILPVNDNYIRSYDIANAYYIYADEENFYFKHIIQRKEKTPMTQSDIVSTIPNIIVNFFKAINDNIKPLPQDKEKFPTSSYRKVHNIRKNKLQTFIPDETFLKYYDNSLNTDDVFPEKWYRPDEAVLVQYTKPFIVALLESEFDPSRNYKEIYNKDNLIFDINENGSFISSKFSLLRMSYIVEKSEYPIGTSIKTFARYIYNADVRIKWDNDFKQITRLEGDDDCNVTHYIMKKPVFFIRERDVIDKTFKFFYQKELYAFASSVSDDFIPLVEDVTRITDYIAGYRIFEDQEKFYFRSLTQFDVKMITPQMLVNKTFPSKIKAWFDEMKKNIVPIHEDEMEKSIIVNFNSKDVLIEEDGNNNDNKDDNIIKAEAIEINDDLYKKYVDINLNKDNFFDLKWYRFDEKVLYVSSNNKSENNIYLHI